MDARFVASCVLTTNDMRAVINRRVNELTGVTLKQWGTPYQQRAPTRDDDPSGDTSTSAVSAVDDAAPDSSEEATSEGI
jgi:hypothetical protein